jgi:hypothetical protein
VTRGIYPQPLIPEEKSPHLALPVWRYPLRAEDSRMEATMNEADYPVAQFKKNASEEVRVSIGEFQGHKLINMRVYFRSATSEWLPSRKGLALGIDRYRELADAVQKVGQALQDLGF